MGSDDRTEMAATVVASDSDKTVIIGASAATALAPGSDETVIVSDGTHSSEGPTLTLGNTSVINNRFELLEILGSGGMGVVFKAKDRRKVEAQDRDPYVAIKLLNDDFKAHPHSIISLQREARRSQKLAHPNIVNVHDFDRDNDQVYMTMECLKGKPLDELLADQKGKLLEPSAAHIIMRDLCAAMTHAHKNSIAHSDFKPGNIFVIESGHAKVLDFGIARAVTNVDTSNSTGNTLFDAGSLGALTPAYASLEMLTGQLPEVSDDVYALGCVAYELFAGRHPFDKKNAVDAKKAGLKPARVKSLSAKQWRALRKALAYKRADRFADAQQFWLAFDDSTKPIVIAAGLLLAILVGVAGWSYQQQTVAFDKVAVEKKIKMELQLKFAKEELSAVLVRPGISPRWGSDLAEAVERYAALVPADDFFLRQARQQAAQRYLDQAGVLRSQKKFDEAKKSLDKAELWGTTVEVVNEIQSDIDAAISKRDAELAAALQRQKRLQQEERERVALQQKSERARLDRERKLIDAEHAEQAYSQALAKVESSLSCPSDFSIDILRKQLSQLKSLSANRYQKLYSSFGDKMAACIERVARRNPASAEELKAAALTVFDESASIQAVKIDYCLRLKPGSGRKSSNSCYDRLADGGRGPKMVVVPAVAGNAALAIGKYEVSSKDLGRFCKAGGQCKGVEDLSSNLPARSVSLSIANAYAAWVSEQTGFNYRLPTYDEWFFAAKAKGGNEDPNRNCTVNALGVQKGEKAVSVTTGRTNDWGLVNTVGNVQEFTTASSGLIAAGGRHTDRLDSCFVATKRSHDGSADSTTGFRLVRALSR